MANAQRRYTSSPLNFDLPQGVKMLMIANVAIYLFNFLLVVVLGVGRSFFEWLMLNPEQTVFRFALWQPFTYMFLHALDPLHVLFNMLMLYFSGPDVERAWGTRRFLQYYVTCGVGAGLIVVFVELVILRNPFQTLGASGAIFGVLLAFAMLFPDRDCFLFPLPIAIKARYFVAILVVLNILALRMSSGVSSLAHLGGIVVGFLFFRARYQGGRNVDWAGSLRQRYKEWKLQRARRKFQVYMNKVNRDRQ